MLGGLRRECGGEIRLPLNMLIFESLPSNPTSCLHHASALHPDLCVGWPVMTAPQNHVCYHCWMLYFVGATTISSTQMLP